MKPAESSPPRRRRRRRRLPLSLDEQQAARHDLARRVIPTVGFFGYSLLAGLLLSLGTVTPRGGLGLVLFGLLLTPLMAPVIGLALGGMIGAPRLLGESLGALGIGSGLVVGMALAVRAVVTALRIPLPPPAAPFPLVDALLALVGALGTAQWLLRNDRRVYLANALLAYTLYYPLVQAGMGRGNPWPAIWGGNLGLALLGALLALRQLGFRPPRRAVAVAGGLVLLVAGGITAAMLLGRNASLPPASPAASPAAATATPPAAAGSLPTPTATNTPPPTPSPTPSPTPLLVLPTPTPSDTPSPSPTIPPVYAIVNAPEEYGGAYVREAPSFNAHILRSIANGTLVEVISELPVEAENATWVEVYVPQYELRGWMVQALLLRATPVPAWEATPSP